MVRDEVGDKDVVRGEVGVKELVRGKVGLWRWSEQTWETEEKVRAEVVIAET